MTEHCYLKGPGAGYSKTASEEYITGNCTDVVAVAGNIGAVFRCV